MRILLSPHAKERAEERGATEDEIIDTVRTGLSAIASGYRFAKEKVYSFGEERNGKFYEEKQVKVIYLLENDQAIIVTVVVKYGNFTDVNGPDYANTI